MTLELFTALFSLIAIVVKLVDFIVKPFFLKFAWDLWWVDKVSFVLGSAFAWATGLNAFPTTFKALWVGQLLTALIAGCGPSILYDAVDKGQIARLPRSF
jgi:hypothetical protein